MSGPVLSPGQRIARGATNVANGNMSGLQDIAAGAIAATSVTALMLDQYLQRNNMSLTQISLPGVSKAIRDSYSNPNSLVAKAMIAGVREATRPDTPEEEKQKKTEAEKEAKVAKEKAEKERETMIAASREAERKRFMRGDNGMQEQERQLADSKKQDNQNTRINAARISIV